MAEMSFTVHCSFCGKANDEVQKVIAGPGVYICDGCVGTCTEILATAGDAPSHRLPEWHDMTDEQILDRLPRIAETSARVDESLASWVGELRRRGVTWSRIGTALGMARQSAWERFATVEPAGEAG